MAKKEQDLRAQPTNKVTNTQSEKYIIAKFNREFEMVIQEMFDQPVEGEGEEGKQESKNKIQQINYLRLKELLINLGMINETAANSDSNERALLYELWKLLRGEESEEVALSDVKLVIMAILRMTDHKRIGVASQNKQT